MCDKFLPGKKKAVIQVLFEQAQILDITGPLEVFSEADRLVSQIDDDPEKGYDIRTVSRHAGPIRTSSGLQLVADFSFDSCLEQFSDCGVDTFLVSGGSGVDDACRDKKLIEFVRRVSKKARRVVSICNGVFILATAGLLSGIKMTTHWAVELELSEKYPDILLDSDKIHINDGRFYSSAGVTAGIDLALFLVEKDYGRQVALAIAKNLVMFMKRQGGQSQFSSRLAEQYADRGKLKDLIDWIKINHSKNITISDLANHACTSERNLSRLFKNDINITPMRFLEKVRVESAAGYLENHCLGLKEIAAACGFGSVEKMRRAFKRQLDVLPGEYRNRFGC